MTSLPEDVVDRLSSYVEREDLEALRAFFRGPIALLPRILGVDATTFGRFVLFRSDRYNLETARGLGLVAHEAMHIGQYRTMGYARFMARYGMHRLRTRSRGIRHPMEAPCIAVQRSVVAALRADGWP